jgi:hypothetical protein
MVPPFLYCFSLLQRLQVLGLEPRTLLEETFTQSSTALLGASVSFRH